MFTSWILLFTLAISSRFLARASSPKTSAENFIEEFTKSCPSDGFPVCGARGNEYFLFPNECLLNEVNKDDLFGQGSLKKVSTKYCIFGCDMVCPRSYEPVCALNVLTHETEVFNNVCEVTKHACKTNMEFIQLHPAACNQIGEQVYTLKKQQIADALPNIPKILEKRSNRKPIPCTSIMRPVCGVYKGVKSTFKNECLMNAENVKFGKDWRVVKCGICDEDYSNVKPPVNRKSKAHSIRKRSYTDSGDYMSFQHRNRRYMNYRPALDMPNNDLYMYAPQVFQTHYVQHELPNSDYKGQMANHIIQKIMSLPISSLEGAQPPPPPVDKHQFVAPTGKSAAFPTNSMELNYKQKISSLYDPNLSGGELQRRSGEEDIVGHRKFEAFRAEHMPPSTYNTNQFFKQKIHSPLLLATLDDVSQEGKHFEHINARAMPFQLNNVNLRYGSHSNSENSKPSLVRQSIEINSYAKNSDNQDESYYSNPFHKTQPPTQSPEKLIFFQKTTTNPQPTVTPTTSTKVEPIFIITRRVTSKESVLPNTIVNKSSQHSKECEFGENPICAVLSNGTAKTFQTLCEMMATNKLQKNTWKKLHDGTCETCKTDCSNDYKPVCVQRNGVNYTMVNECYFNMGICMDKRSKWKKISNGECERYIRFPDKYANVKPGFRFTSKYFPTESTPAITPFTSSPASFVTSTMNLRARSMTNESGKRSIKRISTSDNHLSPLKSDATIKQPESYVMVLGKRKRGLYNAAQTNGSM